VSGRDAALSTAARPRIAHAAEADYQSWVAEHIPHQAARWERVRAYRRFVEAWPDLQAWFSAPLMERLGFVGGPFRANGRTDAFMATSYLTYLSLVHGIGLDHDFLFARKYARLFSIEGGVQGLGFDRSLFDGHLARMVSLGYSEPTARSRLTWGVGRLLLARGDPDMTAITVEDVFDLAAALRAFGARDDFLELRSALYQNKPGLFAGADAGQRYARLHLANVHTVHVLLFIIWLSMVRVLHVHDARRGVRIAAWLTGILVMSSTRGLIRCRSSRSGLRLLAGAPSLCSDQTIFRSRRSSRSWPTLTT